MKFLSCRQAKKWLEAEDMENSLFTTEVGGEFSFDEAVHIIEEGGTIRALNDPEWETYSVVSREELTAEAESSSEVEKYLEGCQPLYYDGWFSFREKDGFPCIQPGEAKSVEEVVDALLDWWG